MSYALADRTDDPEYEELLAQQRARRRYAARLLRHPHPQDPDHPEPLEQAGEEA